MPVIAKRFREYLSLASPGQLPALDGLRGLAILLVVAFHAAESFRPAGGRLFPLGEWDAATPLLNGWMGVNLFFVLSGFLVTHHLLRRWTGPIGWRVIRPYLAKRWLRIVPTYYAVLLAVALIPIPHYPVSRELIGARVAYHALFLQDYLPSSILGPFWSLAVEEKFYLAIPLVLVAAWRFGNPRAGLVIPAALALIPIVVRIGMVLGAPGIPPEDDFTLRYRNPFHLNLDALMLGAIAAWLCHYRDAWPWLGSAVTARRCRWCGMTMTALLLGAAPLLQARGFFDRIAVFPLVSIAFTLLLLGVALEARGRQLLLESRWLGAAGRIAYPWYLVHIVAMWWTWGTLTGWAPGIHAMPPAGQFLLFMPFYLIVSLVAALGLHYALEKPCLLLKDRIGASQRRSGREIRPETTLPVRSALTT